LVKSHVTARERTLIWLFTCMGVKVIFQVLVQRKRLLTESAFKRFDLDMSFKVSIE